MEFTFVSQSAAADIIGPDKHINVTPVERLSARLEKAAKAYAAKVAKADPAVMKALEKAGHKTEKQIAKAIAPVGYFYIPTSAKPVPYSAAKAKANNTTYLRARTVSVVQRARPSTNAKQKLICAVYNKFVVGAELFKEQQALLKAVTSHKAQKEKTSTVIKKVRADNMAATQAGFAQAAASLKEAMGDKVKATQITEVQAMTGAPSMYIKFGTQVLVVRPATIAQLNKAKKSAEAKEVV